MSTKFIYVRTYFEKKQANTTYSHQKLTKLVMILNWKFNINYNTWAVYKYCFVQTAYSADSSFYYNVRPT